MQLLTNPYSTVSTYHLQYIMRYNRALPLASRYQRTGCGHTCRSYLEMHMPRLKRLKTRLTQTRYLEAVGG